jgi:hypothetical protein
MEDDTTIETPEKFTEAVGAVINAGQDGGLSIETIVAALNDIIGSLQESLS